MTAKKNWFGTLDLAVRFAIVFGSLLFSILILGLVKVLYEKKKLREHLKLVDEEGRESKDSHRDLTLRDKDAGDLFGVRAIEAGYFGGVAQSTSNSPTLTPRGSMGDLSQPFHGPQHARSVSSSSALDPNEHGRISAVDIQNKHSSSPRQPSLQLPLSHTAPSMAYAVRKTPSPTKMSPIRPASSPLQAPSMAHIQQIALRPSTAEWTSHHSSTPPIETPIDRVESPHETVFTSEILTPPQTPPPGDSRRHARVFDTSDMVTWFEGSEVPQLLLPVFIGSSEHLVPEFDSSRSNRTSGVSITAISAERKSIDDEALPEPKSKRASMMNKLNNPARRGSRSSPTLSDNNSIAEIPTPLMNASSSEKLSRREAIVPERLLELPASTGGSRAPIPSVIVEGGRFYFDYSKPLTLALPVRSYLSPASSTASRKITPQRAPQLNDDLDADGGRYATPKESKSFILTLPIRSPLNLSPVTSTEDLEVNAESAPRSSEDWSEDWSEDGGDEDVTPRASTFALALALPVRSPLRLSPASSRSSLKWRSKKSSSLSEALEEASGEMTGLSEEENEDVSPRTSFSYEKTLSEYRRGSRIAPPSPPRKYRFGDTPMSSLTPEAMTTPYNNTMYELSAPANSSRRFIMGDMHTY